MIYVKSLMAGFAALIIAAVLIGPWVSIPVLLSTAAALIAAVSYWTFRLLSKLSGQRP